MDRKFVFHLGPCPPPPARSGCAREPHRRRPLSQGDHTAPPEGLASRSLLIMQMAGAARQTNTESTPPLPPSCNRCARRRQPTVEPPSSGAQRATKSAAAGSHSAHSRALSGSARVRHANLCSGAIPARSWRAIVAPAGQRAALRPRPAGPGRCPLGDISICCRACRSNVSRRAGPFA
jgi:hypothetical protein